MAHVSISALGGTDVHRGTDLAIDGGCRHLVEGGALRADLESREDGRRARCACTRDARGLAKMFACGIFVAIGFACAKAGTIRRLWRR